MNYCIYCGHKITANANFCPNCGSQLQGRVDEKKNVKHFIRNRAAKYEQISGIFWIILSISQFFIFLSTVGYSDPAVKLLVIAIWNFINACMGIQYSKVVRSGDYTVPEKYHNQFWSIIFIIVANVGLGGGIGIICGFMDLYVRNYIIKNDYAFDENIPLATKETEEERNK